MLKQGARCPEVGWTAGRPGARDTSESVRGDAGGQSTAGVTRAPVPPPRGTVPPPSAGHARTPRLRGGGPGARRAPHAPGPRLPRPRSAPGRGHSVTPPPPPATPLVPGLLRAEHRWTVCVGSARGGLAPKAGAVSGTAAPLGCSPGAQDCRDSALRGKGLQRSQEHLGQRAGSACEAVPLFGAGAGEPKWILQKVIKDDRWPCLWHSTKAISQNSRNVPQESPVPGTEAAGAGRRGRGRRGRVPSPLLTPVCASAQQQQ